MASGGVLGDVDNNEQVDFVDALLVAVYSLDAFIVMPNNGDIALGDIDADGQVARSDALLIAAYLNDPSDPSLPPGIGKAVGEAASLALSDREVLVALYNATDGPNWTNSTNWLSDKPVGDWYGITASNGRVTRLELQENQLSGPIPAELGDLANLTHLGFGWNQLIGSIPTELSNLANLTHLWLSGNQLSGSIPAELVNLANLTELDLEQNQLTGPIPMDLGRLTQLTWLGLNGNQLTGEIPVELDNLTNLLTLIALPESIDVARFLPSWAI